MKKLIVALYGILLMTCSVARAADRQRPLVNYGLEWGGAVTLLTTHGANYICCDGYRVNEHNARLRFHPNADVKAFVGINCTEQIQCAFSYGYAGVMEDRRISLFELKCNYLPSGLYSNGLFYRASLGVGVPERSPFEAGFLANGGAGYRIKLAGNICLDGICSLQAYLDHPWIMDVDGLTYVPKQNIRRNNAGYFALHFTFALSF